MTGVRVHSSQMIGIVASRFNERVTRKLLQGALDTLKKNRGQPPNTGDSRRYDVYQNSGSDPVEIVWVPGAFEIPLAAQRLIQRKHPAAVICLGAVIRGETPHFEYIAQAVALGIARVALDTGVPVIFGVLTTHTVRQALARAGGRMGNRGAEAAETALQMLHVLNALGRR